MGTPTASLPPLEVPVARGCAALPGADYVAIDGDAHAAARLTPLESRRTEDVGDALFLRLTKHILRTGDNQGADTIGNLLTPDDRRRLAQVLDAGVGA